MAKPLPVVGGKQEIMDLWDNLNPDQPIRMTPLGTDHEGTTYTSDSIRLTGSREFIESVLANLKGLMEYDGNGSRLDPMYIATVSRTNVDGKLVPGDLTGSYAFYLKARSRGRGRVGRVKGSKNKPKDQTDTPVEPTPNPLREVNAGLKLKPKKKEDTPPVQPEPPAKSKRAVPTAPVYAIASSFLDEEGNPNPVWTEPDSNDYECTTYEDFISADDAISKLKKNKAFAKQALEIIQIEIIKGKMVYTQV
jgi:hypothetical protein